MEYRQLPHGNENEKFSVLGLGMGGIGKTPVDEIEAIIRKAIDNGINFFDLCTAGASYAPIGRAIKDCRDQVFLQVHFGAVYDESGEYGWCRDFDTIQKTFLWELEQLGTDYVDFGFLHCVDDDEDFDTLCEIGVLDYLKEAESAGCSSSYRLLLTYTERSQSHPRHGTCGHEDVLPQPCLRF